MSDHHYEIRVTGTLPPEALLDYEDLTLTEQPAETVLEGRLPDQAALNGLLARLEIFRVQVTLVRRHLPPGPDGPWLAPAHVPSRLSPVPPAKNGPPQPV